MLTATESFMDSLEKWLKAARANDFENAKIYAKNMIYTGELMVIHPEFIRSFEQHCHGCDPK